MSNGRQSRVWIAVAIVLLVGAGVYWLGSGKLMHWLLALHGQH